MSTVPRSIEPFVEAWPRPVALARRARAYWYVWLVLAATAVQTVALWRVLGPLPPGAYPPLKDSVIFEYIGWYLADGGRLYVDVWEIKPPLPFELTAVLALLADGAVRRYHVFVLAVTSAAAVGCTLAVGLLTHELTGDEAASVAAGLAMFALPAFHWRAAFGFKAKYFVLLFGLLAVYLALRDRPFLAGAAAAASTGFWQLGLVFPGLALGLAFQQRGWRGVGRTAVGGGLVTAVVLAPVVWWGAVDAMLAEVVVTPLLVTNDGGTVLSQARLAVRLFGRTLPLVLLGAGGLLAGVGRAPRRRWWAAVGAGWFALQVLVLDLDLYPDLLPAFAFAALGLGFVLGDPDHRPVAVYGLLAAMVVLSLVTLGPHAAASPTHPPAPSAIEPPYHGEERPALLWRTVRTETCRPFFGATQGNVVAITGGSYADETCGALEPLSEALVSRLQGRLDGGRASGVTTPSPRAVVPG
ncbi:MAG: DolP-mannose mannosyltransferase [Halobacteriales archaeon]